QRRNRRLQLAARPAWRAGRAARPGLYRDHVDQLPRVRGRVRPRRLGRRLVRAALGLGHRRDRARMRGSRRLHARPWRSRAAARRAGAGCVTVARRAEWTRETLAAAVRAGDKRALARAISLVEDRDSLAYDVIHDLYPETGGAYAIGVTGPPGVGKSSLISALVRHVRADDRKVGVISVDPSS